MTDQAMKKKVLRPLKDRVLAKRIEEETSTKGGIIIPDSAKQKQEVAEVVAVGPGKQTENNQTIEMPVKVGDLILMDRYGSQEVTLDDEEYIIVKADDIIAVVEKA